MAQQNQKNKFVKSGNNPKKPSNFYWIYAVIVIAIIGIQLFNFDGGSTGITEKEFQEMVKKQHVDHVVIVKNKNIARVTLKKEAVQLDEYKDRINTPLIANSPNRGPHFTFEFLSQDEFYKDLKLYAEDDNLKYRVITEEDWFGGLLGLLLPIAIIVVIWIFLMRRMSGGSGGAGQIFSIGKSKAQLFDKENSTHVSFADVAGLEGAKEEVQEIVDFLKKPQKYTNIGAKIPRGALLVGPPGTGKPYSQEP